MFPFRVVYLFLSNLLCSLAAWGQFDSLTLTREYNFEVFHLPGGLDGNGVQAVVRVTCL